MKVNIYVIFVCLFLFLTGCKKQNTCVQAPAIANFTPKQVPIIKLHKAYDIYVDEIECLQCEDDATQALKEIPDVSSVKFQMGPNGYEDGYLKLYYSSKDLDENLVKEKLEDIGFDVIKIVKR